MALICPDVMLTHWERAECEKPCMAAHRVRKSKRKACEELKYRLLWTFIFWAGKLRLIIVAGRHFCRLFSSQKCLKGSDYGAHGQLSVHRDVCGWKQRLYRTLEKHFLFNVVNLLDTKESEPDVGLIRLTDWPFMYQCYLSISQKIAHFCLLYCNNRFLCHY